MFCGNCGSKFRRTKWGRGKNEQIVWICPNSDGIIPVSWQWYQTFPY
ncbi:MAG: zinc ribbon domain-containing protein [Desulfosporosinus sp.]|nr:zinc ribbon domain-containing protein [Desulfosporosinus sp.]